MSAPSRLRAIYLTQLSKPIADRAIYRAIRKHRVRTIVELGFGSGQRAVRMIEMAQTHWQPAEIEFIGIDLFESRTAVEGPGLSLKSAHRLLRTTGIRTNLLPGSPFDALAREANRLKEIDLIVVSSHHDAESLAKAWFYFPRMLHDRSLVFVEKVDPKEGSLILHPMDLPTVRILANSAIPRRAA